MNDEEWAESPTSPPPVEPNWRAMAWKYEELGKQAHYLADEVKRRDKARSEIASASEGIEQYGRTITALQAELIELEDGK